MKAIQVFFVAVLSCGTLQAQPEFALGFDCPDTIGGVSGQTVSFDVFLTLTTTNNTTPSPVYGVPLGAQGWSASVRIENATVDTVLWDDDSDPGTPDVQGLALYPPIPGTKVSTIYDHDGLPGTPLRNPSTCDLGLLGNRGFMKSELAYTTRLPRDPSEQPVGVVTAIVLDTGKLRVLQPEGTVAILKMTLKAAVPAVVYLSYEDNLFSSGEAVKNIATWDSTSYTPTLGTRQVEVLAVQPPAANPGGPYVAFCTGDSTTVYLDGSGSTAPSGGPLSFEWSTDCSDAILLSQDTICPLIIPGCPRTCNVTLKVTDQLGLSATATTAVELISCPEDANCPPVPKIIASEISCVGPGHWTVSLDGSESEDPDGDPLSFNWIASSGCSVSIQNSTSPEATFDIAGADCSVQVVLYLDDGVNPAQIWVGTLDVEAFPDCGEVSNFSFSARPAEEPVTKTEGNWNVIEKTVQIPAGQTSVELTIPVVVDLASSGLEGPDGPPGWSISLRKDDCLAVKAEDIGVDGLIVSTIYKDADPFPLDLADASFKEAEPGYLTKSPRDPAEKPVGVVSAIVLNTRDKMVLHANTTETVLKAAFTTNVVPGRNADCKVWFEDGLYGSGEPAANIATYNAESYRPNKKGLILRLTGELPSVTVDCEGAMASVQNCWPPNHKETPETLVQVEGVKDSLGNPALIQIDGITQDEPVLASGIGSGHTCPDARLVDTDDDGIPDAAGLRCERDGTGFGRIYTVEFTATAQGAAASCSGSVTFRVPHDQRADFDFQDTGDSYDSTVCPGDGETEGGGAAPRVYSLEEYLTLTPDPLFLRGDVDWDEILQINDAMAILGHLFLGSFHVDCSDAADINDDGVIDVSDAVGLLGYLFLGDRMPPPPLAAIGTDPTPDTIGCE